MVPKIKKAEYQLVDISDDGFVTYINDKAESVSYLKLETDLQMVLILILWL
jgi:hypothetical protein